jgi:NAD(P)-dependent dehydrogenase (short-subunit alcohol dehydrogenase family)
MGHFEGRHVVVTGGTGSLGSAVVQALVDGGAICHVTCVSDPEFEAFELRQSERVRVVRPVDLTNEAHVVGFYRRFDDDAPLWASLHLAGGFAMGPIEEASAADFDHQMQLNALTCFLCCREAIEAMRRAGAGGRIVNVAARPALFPELGGKMVAYTAGKAAVAAMTQALSAELAGEGILVNAVVPSIIDTPANREAMPQADHDAWARPAQIAETILFLASPANETTRAALVPVYGRG